LPNVARVLPPRGQLSYMPLNTSHRAGVARQKKPRCHPQQRSALPFSRKFSSLCPPRQQIHIISTIFSPTKPQAVREFLHNTHGVQFSLPRHRYSSWLNQVEIWFAKIRNRGRLCPRHFHLRSPGTLARKLRAISNAYSANAPDIR